MAISKIKSESIDLTDTGYTFGDLLVSGDLTIDTSSLTVDSTNNRVGIGTTSPQKVLHILNTTTTGVTSTSPIHLRLEGNNSNYYDIGRDNQNTGFLSFYGNQSGANGYIFGGANGELMRITNSGNVGIGITSVSQKLDVVSSTVNTGMLVYNTNTTSGASVPFFLASESGGTTTNVSVENGHLGALVFRTGATTKDGFGSERMRIDSSGNVGIGTTSPNQKLTVAGNIEIYRDDVDGYIWFHDYGTRSWALGHDVTNGAFVINLNSDLTANNKFAIGTNGNVGIGTTSPSAELEIASSSTQIRLTDTDTNAYAEIGTDGSGILNFMADEGNTGASPRITFDVSTSEKMRITSDGKVGIGTTSPSFALSVSSTSSNTITAINTASNVSRFCFAENSTPSNTYTNIEGDARSNGYMAFRTNDTERMRIDSSGRVGIGTTSPTTQLYVDGSGSGTFSPYNDPLIVEGQDYTIGLHIKGTNSQAMIIYNRDGSNGWFTGLENSGHFKFENMTSMNGTAVGNAKDTGNPVFMLRTDGVVTVNTTAPASNEQMTIQTSNDTRVMSFKNGGGGEAGYIYMNSGGSGVTYSTSSDYRLKENVVSLTNAIDRVKQLQPKRFNFIDDDKTLDGFIAHEVQPIVPEAVTGEKDGMHTYIDEEDGIEKTKPSYQGIDQSKLVPLLTAALKESLTKIDELEQRISALENS